MSDDGLITLCSSFGHRETIARLETAIRAHGMQVFARIDHAKGALAENVAIPPTVTVTFGNTVTCAGAVGAVQVMALRLPFSTLVWEDGDGATWLSYDDLRWFAQRHSMTADRYGDVTASGCSWIRS